MIDMFCDVMEKFFDLERREVQSIECIDRVEIDRDRQHLSIDACLDPMLILPPLGKCRKILEELLRISMKNMWAVAVYENPRLVIVIVRISTDMIAAIDEQYALILLRGQTLDKYTSGEA